MIGHHSLIFFYRTTFTAQNFDDSFQGGLIFLKIDSLKLLIFIKKCKSIFYKKKHDSNATLF